MIPGWNTRPDMGICQSKIDNVLVPVSKPGSNFGTSQPADSALAQSILAPGKVTLIQLLRSEVPRFTEAR